MNNPKKNSKNEWVHRKIMGPIILDTLEELFPDKDWIVHHKDGDKSNNDIFNLEVMERYIHTSYHAQFREYDDDFRRKCSESSIRNYRRIVKNGRINGEQRYSIKDGAKIIFSSTNINKLEEML